MDPYFTPPLSLEGWREIEDEIANGSPMTPERRAMFDRVQRRKDIRAYEIEQGRHDPHEPVVLSEEGSREVLDEIENGSPDTPGRRAMFDLVQQMAGVRKRRPGHMRRSPDPYRPTPPLSLEGSREVEEEMARPPADTPERRALFERVHVRAAMRARMAEEGRDVWKR
jgi:hypothetical protein